VSKANPIFYLIDGFRYGALGGSEHSPAADLWVSCGVGAVFFVWAFWLIRTGYRIKS
jgi:ABC-2 type transport system permease protein